MEQNSFFGANTVFVNRSLHALLAEIIKIRQQLTVRNELYTRSGWNNAMNTWLETVLNMLRDTVENISYNPDATTLSQLKSNASDTTRTVKDDYNARALASDNLLMPNTQPYPIVWDLTGADPDLPQITVQNCPNDWFRLLIKGLDELFVQSTRLDSRHERNLITKYEGAMLCSLINELFTIVQRKGGEVNRTDIPVGTLPSQEPATFKGSESNPTT